MRFSKEILDSLQKGLSYYNLEEVFTVINIEHIQNGKIRTLNKELIYWLDSTTITEGMIAGAKGIILISRQNEPQVISSKSNGTKIIVSEDPSSLAYAIDKLLYNDEFVHSIHRTVDLHPKAKIGQNVHIAAFTVIDECTIGDNSVIHDHCFIGRGVNIGNNSEIHGGAKIGLSVFGYKKNFEGEWLKHHHIGSVNIGNHVTIGSNACINNGFIINTVIEDEVFIDNLCHIGSSALIGQGTIVAANSFIAQHSIIGKRCWISAGVSIRENIRIIDDVFIGIGSVVLRDIKKPGRYFGNPIQQILI